MSDVRVLHVVLGLEIGGLEAFVLDLTRAYRDNVQSLIVCLRGQGAIMAKETGHVEIRYLDGSENFSWALVRELASIVRRENIDVIHTHNPGPHLYGALAGRLTSVPVLHTKHGRNYPENRRKVLLNRVVTMLTDRIIAVSRDAEQVCREIESVPQKKLRTILNGIDLAQFVPREATGSLRRELGIAAGTPIVGIVARLSRVKNHPLLFRAVQCLLERGVDHALVVIGDGPLEGDLRRDVEELGLTDTVHFLGARSDVAELYPEMDVFVLSSRSEGVSLTLLEAMSCELPVVATDVGGNPEVVVDGVTGFIVSQEADALAGALETLIGGDDARTVRRQMGVEGRKRVASHFSMDATAAAYYDEYLQLRGAAAPGTVL